MSKDRVSASVDSEVAAYLQQDTVNASGTINKLVKREIYGGDSDEELLRLRLEQVQSERESLESRVEEKREQEEQLKERLEEYEEDREDVLEQAASILRPQQLTEDNDAVEKFADQANMDVDEFLDEIEGRLG